MTPRTFDEFLKMAALEGDPPVFKSKAERDLFEQRYAEANPRVDAHSRKRGGGFFEELIEKQRGRT